MPQLYKHNKGKWLLCAVVSKNTAGNEEKWRSLRGRPVMCHWPTLRPKINHERGALWLRCGHPWSINPPAAPPSVFLCIAAPPPPPQTVYKHLQKLNQHKWRWIADIYGQIWIDYPGFDFRGSSSRSWRRRMCSSFIQVESIYKPIIRTFTLDEEESQSTQPPLWDVPQSRPDLVYGNMVERDHRWDSSDLVSEQ